MTEQEFKALLALGHETRGVEFKTAGKRTDKAFLALVVRAALGMTNRQDGGLIVIGVADDGTEIQPIGLGAGDLPTWTHNSLGDSFGEYADPAIVFDLERLQFDDKTLVVLHVHEFDDVPVLCKKDYPGTLRAGACYVRTRKKPESSEIPGQTEMRELIELATSKGLRKTLRMLRDAGVDLGLPGPPADKALFDQQIKDLL